MKNFRNTFCYLFLIFVILNSCKKESDSISKLLVIEEFDEIVVKSYFEIVFIQGNENSIRLEGKANEISKIDLQVEDSVLTIKNLSKSVWINPDKNKVKLYITFKNLKKLNLNQSCQVSNQGIIQGKELGIIFASKLNEANLNLDYETIYYWNNFPCGGKLQLSGKSSSLKIWNFALMSVDAKNLVAKQVIIDNSSKGDCFVYASESIEYGVFGEGNIYLFGKPQYIHEKEKSIPGKLIIE